MLCSDPTQTEVPEGPAAVSAVMGRVLQIHSANTPPKKQQGSVLAAVTRVWQAGMFLFIYLLAPAIRCWSGLGRDNSDSMQEGHLQTHAKTFKPQGRQIRIDHFTELCVSHFDLHVSNTNFPAPSSSPPDFPKNSPFSKFPAPAF